MGYFDTDHNVAPQITAGGSVGFFDNVQQGFEQQFRVDSPLALREEIDNRWKESLDLLEQTTGERQVVPWGRAITDYARVVSGEEIGDPVGLPPQALQIYRQQMDQLRSVDERIKSLGDPRIKDYGSIVREVVGMQRATEQQTQEYSDRSGVLGTVGQFIGAMGGSFTTRDPVSLFSLPLGGEGTIVQRIGIDMGLGAASVAATVPDVNVNRQFAGLEERNPVYEMAAAAVGAGLLRGAFEGGGRLLERFRTPDISLDFTDTQLRQLFETLPESPRARAGLALLDQGDTARAASPYGDSAVGLARFNAELEDVARVVSGQADTAIGRVWAAPGIADSLPPVPFEFLEKNFDFELVKAEVPEVYGRLTTARADLAAVDERILGLEAAVDQPSLVDAIARIDENTADLVRSFADDLENPQLTVAQREDIARRVNQIVESLGVDRVAREMQDAQIQPRQDLRRARQERKAANQRYKDAYKAVEAEAAAIRTKQALLQGPAPITSSASILDYTPVVGDSMRYDVVQTRADAVEAVADLTDARTKQIIAKSEPVEGEAPIPDDGLVDIGLAERVDGSSEFIAEDGTVMTFKQALDDLREDEALEEAMRICSL